MTVNADLYFAFQNLMIFFGDSYSRKFAYHIRFRDELLKGQMPLLAMFLVGGF